MKGIDPVLSHILFFASGIIALTLIISIAGNWRAQTLDRLSLAEAESAANKIKAQIELLPSISEANITLNAPDRIADKGYAVYFSGKRIDLVYWGKNMTAYINKNFELAGSAIPPALLSVQGNKIILVD